MLADFLQRINKGKLNIRFLPNLEVFCQEQVRDITMIDKAAHLFLVLHLFQTQL